MNKRNTTYKHLEHITEVKELKDVSEVNRLIKQGWKLIDTYTISVGLHQQSMHYCVGKPNEFKTADMDPVAASDSRKFLYSI